MFPHTRRKKTSVELVRHARRWPAMLGIDSSPAAVVTVVLGLTTIAIALRYVSARKLHPDEPTVLPPWIPFVGHLLGMALEGSRYIKQLG